MDSPTIDPPLFFCTQRSKSHLFSRLLTFRGQRIYLWCRGGGFLLLSNGGILAVRDLRKARGVKLPNPRPPPQFRTPEQHDPPPAQIPSTWRLAHLLVAFRQHARGKGEHRGHCNAGFPCKRSHGKGPQNPALSLSHHQSNSLRVKIPSIYQPLYLDVALARRLLRCEL